MLSDLHREAGDPRALMVGAWEHEDELPRFVSLLRMASGPVERNELHCGEALAIEELEELSDEQFFNAEAKSRCILSCRNCGYIAWAWFD